MKTLRIVSFLVIYVSITFLWLLYDRRNIFDNHTLSDIFQLPAIWVFPILMIVVGLLFGWLYSNFNKKKNKNFILGQLTCLVITFLSFIYTLISDQQHEKRFGNINNNRANRNNTFYPVDTVYQIKAYNALIRNFSDENSFRITELFSGNKDTVINSVSTKMHISWFGYYLNKDRNRVLCAKYLVFNDTVVTEYVNRDAATNLDFINRKMYKDSLLKLVDSLSD